jgi:hypothetical protein
MEYFVGWVKVHIWDRVMNYHRLKLSSAEAGQEQVPGEEPYWGEDKVIQFRVSALPPGKLLGDDL